MLDASIACSWCFPNDPSENTELSRYALALLGSSNAVVPELWAFEIANILTKAIRRQRITADQASNFISILKRLPIQTESGRFLDNATLYAEAIGSGLTAYDAAYLDLAKRRRIALATSDVDLANAARQVNVDLVVVPTP